jgi:cyclohexanone monooxygenase/pentalenolactone D synthase
MFVMPAPGQQAVVTVNYTQLAVLGAEFIAGAVARLEQQGVEVFDVSADAEEAWTKEIVSSFVDPTAVMSACTPSRLNNEGHPEEMNPRNGNYGRGLGDWFAYRDLLERWLEAGTLEGLELRVRSAAS